jgi:hypothetical protein
LDVLANGCEIIYFDEEIHVGRGNWQTVAA